MKNRLFTFLLLFSVNICQLVHAERIALVAAYQGELDAILEFIPNEQIEEIRIINGVTFTLATA